MASSDLSHVRDDGSIEMVDVSDKAVTSREATASCRVAVSSETLALLRERALPKGDVLATAKVAGVLAAKQTSSLIPLTHPLMLSYIDVGFEIVAEPATIVVRSTVRCEGKTGVEIEAMTACAVAALTIYDMCKSADKRIVINELQLESKRGGKSGEFSR